MKFIKALIALIGIGLLLPITNIKTFRTAISELKNIDFWNSNLGWTIKLYSLTIVIPFSGTIMVILFKILGQTTKQIFELLYDIWVGFYFNGSFLSIDAWRWQLVLFIIAFLFTLSEGATD